MASSNPRNLYLILLLSFFWALTSANVYCNNRIPPFAVPPLESCDLAINALAQMNRQCGQGSVIFGNRVNEGRSVLLPSIFIGSQPQDPSSGLLCAIYILWQPKPGAPPPVSPVDIFPFRNILTAAIDIRDGCLAGSERHDPQLGRAWIAPHLWVDVQFGSVFGPKGSTANSSNIMTGNITVSLADGTNQTIDPSMLGQVGSCGFPTVTGKGSSAYFTESS